jgi:hypothetical protein
LLLALFFTLGGLIVGLSIPWPQPFWGIVLASVGWVPFAIAFLRPSISNGRGKILYTKEFPVKTPVKEKPKNQPDWLYGKPS